MMKIETSVFGRKIVSVPETSRALVLDHGKLVGVLAPGRQPLKIGRDVTVVEVPIGNGVFSNPPAFVSPYEQALFANLPDVANGLFDVFQTGPTEVLIVERDRRIHSVVGPDSRLVVWKDAGPWTVRSIDVADAPAVERALLQRLLRAQATGFVTVATVSPGQVGLVTVDGVVREQLPPGVHGLWNACRSIAVKAIDLRSQVLDIGGQEMLTHDKVTIRVNLSAAYRVVDAETAAFGVDNYADRIYRALQGAFRRTLGARTIDEILEHKAGLDADARAAVDAEMSAIGIAMERIDLKDVILPGDMRDILNKVVAAQKEAEANIIRRREETNATRSLLNTARVMAENPVMLRLKELEALEKVSEKIGSLTVHNGTGGLLNDLVRLREG